MEKAIKKYNVSIFLKKIGMPVAGVGLLFECILIIIGSMNMQIFVPMIILALVLGIAGIGFYLFSGFNYGNKAHELAVEISKLDISKEEKIKKARKLKVADEVIMPLVCTYQELK